MKTGVKVEKKRTPRRAARPLAEEREVEREKAERWRR
jgi:hypothetical protein